MKTTILVANCNLTLKNNTLYSDKAFYVATEKNNHFIVGKEFILGLTKIEQAYFNNEHKELELKGELNSITVFCNGKIKIEDKLCSSGKIAVSALGTGLITTKKIEADNTLLSMSGTGTIEVETIISKTVEAYASEVCFLALSEKMDKKNFEKRTMEDFQHAD